MDRHNSVVLYALFAAAALLAACSGGSSGGSAVPATSGGATQPAAAPTGAVSATPTASPTVKPVATPTPTATPSPAAVATAGPAGANAYRFAPYADMGAWPQFQMGPAAQSTGARYYTMAFVVSDGTCRGAWGGNQSPGDPNYGPYFAQQVSAIRALGGDAIVSFGGENGSELAQACSDAPSTAAAYEAIVDDYAFTHIDFDIEGAAVADPVSVARRSQALALVQQHYAALNRPLSISYTLPVEPSGLDDNGLATLRSAVAAGVKLSVVNIMAMDFGDYGAPSPQGKMGAYAIQAGQSTVAQLASVYPGTTDAQRYAMLGVTPMIGVNDTSDEIFGLSDAQQLLTWAQQNGVGRIAFWSATRDTQCSGGATSYASSTCSGVLQSAGAYQKLFASY